MEYSECMTAYGQLFNELLKWADREFCLKSRDYLQSEEIIVQLALHMAQ